MASNPCAHVAAATATAPSADCADCAMLLLFLVLLLLVMFDLLMVALLLLKFPEGQREKNIRSARHLSLSDFGILGQTFFSD